MYNIRLSLRKAALHRTITDASRQPSPSPTAVPQRLLGRGARGEGLLPTGLATLLTIDTLLFALLILRILETRGG